MENTKAQIGRIKELADFVEHDLKMLKQFANKDNSEGLIKDSAESANNSLSALMMEINKLGHKPTILIYLIP